MYEFPRGRCVPGTFITLLTPTRPMWRGHRQSPSLSQDSCIYFMEPAPISDHRRHAKLASICQCWALCPPGFCLVNANIWDTSHDALLHWLGMRSRHQNFQNWVSISNPQPHRGTTLLKGPSPCFGLSRIDNFILLLGEPLTLSHGSSIFPPSPGFSFYIRNPKYTCACSKNGLFFLFYQGAWKIEIRFRLAVYLAGTHDFSTCIVKQSSILDSAWISPPPRLPVKSRTLEVNDW